MRPNVDYMQIDDKKFVSLTYDLYVGGEDGTEKELMESATKEHPLNFTYGIGMMLEKFEENLKGLNAGDKFDFTIQPADAYGEYDDRRLQNVEREVFLDDKGNFDSEAIAVGKVLRMVNEDGAEFDGAVVEVTDKHVKMDFNHPLAGEVLNFKGEVLMVRDATEEEIAVATMPHGKCHGGCGDCGGNCDGKHGEGKHGGCGHHGDGCGNGHCH